MFKRKKPCAFIRLANAQGAVLYDGPIARMAVPESVVLALSNEFFSDPAPCHIHRGAVLSRVFLELRQAAEGLGDVAVASLPEALRGYLAAYAGAQKIRFYEQEAP